MRHLIAGTAGHIDHGKTALVRALTGIDTDRLEEEKRRGISINLGFAHLDLTPDLTLGLVDVPGHERFVKNMLAGATGIDLVILVIAADEGIKPQTREHFEICRLLGIEHGVVALTKAEMATRDLLDVRRMELEEFFTGSFLASAAVVPVSAVTGLGLDDLRRALARAAAAAVEVRAKNHKGLARLPIDRSFSIRGHGTVVTGTLIGGSLADGDEVQLYPSTRRGRVRGVEVHEAAAERAFPGQRTAVNLAGVDVAEAHRGMTLGPAGILRATRQVDASFELLHGAKPLKHGTPVHFHAGTAEVQAEARLISSSLEPMRPGTRSYVRFVLREPLLLLPGDRFIARMFSPVVTMGGGTVLEIASPARMRRAELAQRCATLDQGTVPDRLLLLATESGLGMSVLDAVARTGLTTFEIQAALAAPPFFFISDSHQWFASRAWTEKKTREIHDALTMYHQSHALRAGMPKEQLRAAVLKDAPTFLLDALLALQEANLRLQSDMVGLKSHRVALGSGEEAAARAIEDRFHQAGLAVPSAPEVLASCGVEATRARTLLEMLVRSGKLVRIGQEFIYHASALEALRSTLTARKGTRFTVAEFKEWTGVSRKYAIPLLEFLDRQRVTRRVGDARVVL